MLKRIYVNNYKCLDNFEMDLEDISSLLLIGKNGSGKSTVRSVLEIFQKISRGHSRVKELLGKKDFFLGKFNVPIRFELEAFLDKKMYKYVIAFELPEGFRELRILEEKLDINGQNIFIREEAQIKISSGFSNKEVQFRLDWHLVALPTVQYDSDDKSVEVFQNWLSRMIILSPVPSHITGDSGGETLEPAKDGRNFAEWMTGVLVQYPAAYSTIDQYLKIPFPDFDGIRNQRLGEDFRSLLVKFKSGDSIFSVDFKELSDGEKCFFINAMVLAANDSYGPVFCFWDEPDNYIALSDVRKFVKSLRKSFRKHGQIMMASHNPEAIEGFSNENTFLLSRSSHLEPTRVRRLDLIEVNGGLVDALITDDLRL